jgi:alkanesulfonate monooxygenase SsuD/methylene tetrahydromethanopterin reductase-like flavin-dependent oxidoreductase (luciferase family)
MPAEPFSVSPSSSSRSSPSGPAGTLHLAALIDAREDAREPHAAAQCAELVRLAEQGGLDFVVLECGAEAVLDSVAVPARVAAVTDRIGVLPLLAVGGSDPAPALATLDWVSHGRGGWAVVGPAASASATSVGAGLRAGTVDAAGAVAAVAADWDACAAGAGPRARARAPQGRPVIAVNASDWPGAGRLVAARHADIAFVRAARAEQAARDRAALRGLAAEAGRDPDRLLVFADLAIDLGGGELGQEPGVEVGPVADGAGGLVFRGGPVDLAELIVHWRQSGAVDGFLVRPLEARRDLERFVNGTVALLQHRGLFRTFHPGATLREHLGLHRPARGRARPLAAAPGGTATP